MTDFSYVPSYTSVQNLHNVPHDSSAKYKAFGVGRAASPPPSYEVYHQDPNREAPYTQNILDAPLIPNKPYHNDIPHGQALAPRERAMEKPTPTLDSSSVDATAEQIGDEEAMRQMLSWIPPLPPKPKATQTPLQNSVVIPQIDVGRLGSQMPFMRAYSPALISHEVDSTTFLAFIDNLTIAQAAPPPLQALNLVSTGIGFVPHHWAQLTSNCIGLASGLGSAVVTKTRTKLFMEKANKLYFGPRGLKALLCNHDELYQVLRLPETLPVFAPLDASTGSCSIAERRLRTLAGYISPLTFEVPPPTAMSNALDRLIAKQTNATIAKNRKKLEKERLKYFANEPLPQPGLLTASHVGFSGASSGDSSFTPPQVTSNSGSSAACIHNDYGRCHSDLQALETKMRQVNLAADQASLSCVRPQQLEEVEMARRREILALQREGETIRRQLQGSVAAIKLNWLVIDRV